jgi:hypothetical protein
MTDDQLERLPATLRMIIAKDRALKRWRGQSVIDFQAYRDDAAERQQLHFAAEQRWGHRLRTEYPG